MRQTPTRARRDGFTLVELLIVITIISILVALSAAAVVKVIGKGDEVKVRSEISQLSAAIQAFKTDFKVDYLPSRLVLPPANDSASAQYITRLWPRLPAARLSDPTYWGAPTGGSVVLQGHQTLVFFLGGPQVGTTQGVDRVPVGFSSSPTDPMNTTATTKMGRYFDGFTPDRLKVVGIKNPFPSFWDAYGTAPYLYFSSKGAGNDYDNPTGDPRFSVAPYQTTAQRFANPNGFQIICAGKDGTFGPGGVRWAGVAPNVQGGGATAQGADDMANFHPTLLGIGQ